MSNTNAIASRTTASMVDSYTAFSICSRWRVSEKPGSLLSAPGDTAPTQQAEDAITW